MIIYDSRRPDVYPVYSDKLDMVVIETDPVQHVNNRELHIAFLQTFPDSFLLFAAEVAKKKWKEIEEILGHKSLSSEFYIQCLPFSDSAQQTFLDCTFKIEHWASSFVCCIPNDIRKETPIIQPTIGFISVLLSKQIPARSFIEFNFDNSRLYLFSTEAKDFDRLHAFAKENM